MSYTIPKPRASRPVDVALTMVTLAVLCVVPRAQAQIGLCPTADGVPMRVTMTQLDTTYPSVFDRNFAMVDEGDTLQSKDAKVLHAWTMLIDALNQFLWKNDFHWEKPTRVFCRFYCQRDGSIDYVMTEVKTPGFDRVAQLCTQFRAFAKNHRLDIRGQHQFSHCGMVTFTDKVVGERNAN